MALRTPMAHQQEAIDYAQDKSSIALFMEMRLGKSLVAIRWARSKLVSGGGRVLIVAPLTVLPSWYEELLKEDIAPRTIFTITGNKKRWFYDQAPRVANGWFLINYEAIRVMPEIVSKIHWQVCICDESTKIRNPQAQITKLLAVKYGSLVPNRAILSGLPAPESPLDYYCQFKFLYGQFMGCTDYWRFRQNFFAPDFNGWNWRPKQGTINRLKEIIHQYAFVLT